MTFLFVLLGARELRSSLLSRRQDPAAPQRYALLISIGLLLLLATGLAYRSHDLLDLFRVPARALAVMAIAIVLFVIMRVKWLSKDGFLKPGLTGLLIFASAVQVAGSAWPIRPRGSLYSPYDASVQQLADVLKTDNAKSVWISTEQLSRMYVHVGLTRNNLALPNVYYGDMGQVIEIHGSHCGYSFDHLIAFERLQGPAHELRPAVEWSNAKGTIALQNLLLLREIELDGGTAYVYRVVCRG